MFLSHGFSNLLRVNRFQITNPIGVKVLRNPVLNPCFSVTANPLFFKARTNQNARFGHQSFNTFIMNKTQTSYLRMFYNTQETLDANSALWVGIPAVINVKNDFDELIQRIEAVSEKVRPASKPVTANKAKVLKGLLQKVIVIAGALQAYAAISGNTVLAGNVKLTKSDLDRARETDVEALVKPVIELARAELDALADYGISEAMLTETETSLDNFKALIGRPRTIRNQAFAAMNLLEELFDAANNLLKNKLDPVMIRFKFTNTDFYSEYERARNIVDS